MKKTGFYIIKDKFFEDIPDPYLKGNKAGKDWGVFRTGNGLFKAIWQTACIR